MSGRKVEKPTPGVVYRARMTDRCPIRVASVQEKDWGRLKVVCEIESGACVLPLEVVSSKLYQNSYSCKCLLPDGNIGWIDLFENAQLYWDDNPVSVWLEKVEP